MSSTNVLELYEIGLRGRPVARIAPGDLADPYRKSLWQRVAQAFRAFVEVARETRAMEQAYLGRTTYRDLS